MTKKRDGLSVLRTLLRRDYLTAADWETAVRDLAAMAKQAVGARESLVALLDEREGTWTAHTSSGRVLSHQEISLYGSRSVLEQVRVTGAPLISRMRTPLLVRSESLLEHEVQSLAAVPLFWWDVQEGRMQRSLGGCLYAHRDRSTPPFSEEDLELFRDLAELGQRNLNLLRHLGELRTELLASRQRLQSVEKQLCWRLGEFETRDEIFAQEVLSVLQRVCTFDKVGLLIMGPTGSGKSYLARSFHSQCTRRDKPFVVLDCSQVVSAETLAAELFGYASHSGYANAPPEGRPGKAELADGGTLFIDEIGTLPGELQQRLLRLVQSGAYSPLGSSEERNADVQLIVATNVDLPRQVRQGRFREDLFWRLAELLIQIPPLPKRAADIPHLAEKFLANSRRRFGREDLDRLSPAAVRVLCEQDWSQLGNVRGLEQTINRAALLAPLPTAQLDPAHLKFQTLAGSDRPASLSDPEGRETAPDGETPLVRFLKRKILEHRGTISAMASDSQVAEQLGYDGPEMPPSSLAYRIRKLELGHFLERERRRSREELPAELLEWAIREYGSGTAAAEALGVTPSSLNWQLHKSGLRIREIRPRSGQQG